MTLSLKQPDHQCSRVVVVIVTYQSRLLIERCLHSLLVNQGALSVVVVDNASSDGTVEYIQEKFPSICLVASQANLGFAAGVNRGVQAMPSADFYFLVNPDSIIKPHAIPQLLQTAELQEDVGVFGPSVYDDEDCLVFQPSCRRFPTLLSGGVFNRHSPLNLLFKGNRHTSKFLYEGEFSSNPRIVDWVSGCAMLIRRQVFEHIGNFDEGFFFFCEDVDYCWRAHKAQWKVMYCPDAQVVHFCGKSSDFVPFRILLCKYKSMFRLYKKHIRKTILTDPIVVIGGIVQFCLRFCLEVYRYWAIEKVFEQKSISRS